MKCISAESNTCLLLLWSICDIYTVREKHQVHLGFMQVKWYQCHMQCCTSKHCLSCWRTCFVSHRNCCHL